MSTPRRFFQKDGFYHIYNRGNRKNKIFLDKRDYVRFLEKAKLYKDKYNVEILCYCLIPNHFHFLVRQISEVPLSKFMLTLSTSYSKYFNLKYDEVGRLFQERFQAKLIETDEYLIQLSRYIHINHSKKAEKLEGYKWSSLNSYVNPVGRNDLVNSDFILNYFSSKNSHQDYKEFVLAAYEEKIDGNIKTLMMDL